MRKMLEHRNTTDSERMKGLEAQLKEARNAADDADKKYDEVIKGEEKKMANMTGNRIDPNLVLFEVIDCHLGY